MCTTRKWGRQKLLGCVLLLLATAGFGRQVAWGEGTQTLIVAINRGLPIRSATETPTISGATDAPPDARVQVTIGEQTETTTVTSGRTWSVDWPTPLPPGVYKVEVHIEDSIGSVGTATQALEVSGSERLPRRPLRATPEEFDPVPLEESADADFQAVTDRWRIVPPPYEVNVKGSLWDPYNQNVLKGDLPVYGQNIFLNLTGMSDTLVELRKLPTPSGVSSDRPGSAQFLGNDSQFFLNQNFVVSADLFKGDTAFRPFDWRIKATLVGNINYLNVDETGIVNPDVRKGTDRQDGIPALQEAFVEKKLADLSPNFDFVSTRVGIQPFNSDFKGFVFSDTNLGARLFGNYDSNRYQYNLVYFNRLEKDTNSGLNRLRTRDQQVLIGNLYRQDFLVKGYTTQVSIHQLWEGKSFHFDQNNFLARPDPVGSFRPHAINATYYGWTGFGHFGRLNVDHAFYFVNGHDTKNPIAGRSVDIAAYMGALELSYDRDWLRPKISYFHASGDGDPIDGKAHGFDAIFDNPQFAGGGFSF